MSHEHCWQSWWTETFGITHTYNADISFINHQQVLTGDSVRVDFSWRRMLKIWQSYQSVSIQEPNKASQIFDAPNLSSPQAVQPAHSSDFWFKVLHFWLPGYYFTNERAQRSNAHKPFSNGTSAQRIIPLTEAVADKSHGDLYGKS